MENKVLCLIKLRNIHLTYKIDPYFLMRIEKLMIYLVKKCQDHLKICQIGFSLIINQKVVYTFIWLEEYCRFSETLFVYFSSCSLMRNCLPLLEHCQISTVKMNLLKGTCPILVQGQWKLSYISCKWRRKLFPQLYHCKTFQLHWRSGFDLLQVFAKLVVLSSCSLFLKCHHKRTCHDLC